MDQQPEQDGRERMLIAVGHGGVMALLALSGSLIETDLRRGDGGLVDQIRDGVTDHDPQEPGLWVWEGHPWAEMSHSYYEGDEFEGYRFDNGGWRPPTADELAALLVGQSPWPSMLDREELAAARADMGAALVKAHPAPRQEPDSVTPCDASWWAVGVNGRAYCMPHGPDLVDGKCPKGERARARLAAAQPQGQE